MSPTERQEMADLIRSEIKASGVLDRLDAAEERLGSISGRLDAAEEQLGSISGRLDAVDERLDSMLPQPIYYSD